VKEDTRDFLKDASSLVVGLILFFILSALIVGWSETKNDYYRDNPDFVAGTYTMIGILLVIPLIIFASVLFFRGITTIGSYAIQNYATEGDGTK